jgi:hypothetical protein
MAKYLISSEIVPSNSPTLQLTLAQAYAKKLRPACLCKLPSPTMYIAKLPTGFFVKRMPGTGPEHDNDCSTYDPSDDISGLSSVGSAIVEDPDEGITRLKFDFVLKKASGVERPIPTPQPSSTAADDPKKLTLRSTLDFLWDQSSLNKYRPEKAGKPPWAAIRHHLLEACQGKEAKRSPLSELVYIPEPFFVQSKDSIAFNRTRLLNQRFSDNGKNSLMILIAPFKSIQAARAGYSITFKHLPDFLFLVSETLHKRIIKKFQDAFDLLDALPATQLIAITTFSLSKAQVPSIEEIGFMNVTTDYLPFDTMSDHQLLENLQAQKRHFIKPLRYNLHPQKPLASFVLTDTQPLPTALYNAPSSDSQDYNDSLSELQLNPSVQHLQISSTVETSFTLPPKAIRKAVTIQNTPI